MKSSNMSKGTNVRIKKGWEALTVMRSDLIFLCSWYAPCVCDKVSLYGCPSCLGCPGSSSHPPLCRPLQSTRISDSFAGFIPRLVRPRSKMYSGQIVLGQNLVYFPVGVASRTCFTNHSRNILVAWLNKRSCDPSTVVWMKSGSTYEFHSFAFCRKGSHCELFAKIPPLRFDLIQRIFSHCFIFMTICRNRNEDRFKNWQFYSVWKLRFCDYRTIKLTTAFFDTPCIRRVARNIDKGGKQPVA